MSGSIDQSQLEALIELVRTAGDKVKSIRDSGTVEDSSKGDGSIVTNADIASNKILMADLQSVIDIPIVSEEIEELYPDGDYWLIDPLDGTSDFAKGRDNYAVMVALMRNQKPVLGVVYAPSKDEMFYGGSEISGAFLTQGESKTELALATAGKPPYKVVASRSHMHPKTAEFLNGLGEHELLSIGSGLKFCYVATGQVDIYVRYQGTYEWDTAAPQAIVEAAGVELAWQDENFTYGKKGRLNTGFICKPKSLDLELN